MAKRLSSNWAFWLAVDKGTRLLAQYFHDVCLKSVVEMPLARAFISKGTGHMEMKKSSAKTAVKCFLLDIARNREVDIVLPLLLVAEA